MKHWLSCIVVIAFIIAVNPCFAGNHYFSENNGNTGDGDTDKKKKKEAEGEQIDFLSPRAKFFDFSFIHYPLANDGINEEQFGDEVDDSNILLKTKLRFPVFLKQDFILFGEFSYNYENIYFSQDVGGFGNVDFQKLGIVLFGEKSLSDDKYLIGALSISNKSEKSHHHNVFTPNSISTLLMLGKNYGENNKLGYGFSASYNLGRIRVSPVMAFYKRMGRRHVLEGLLPKSLTYRHIINNDFYFYTAIEASKSNYAFDDYRIMAGENQLEIRRTEVAFNVGLEREIHDWLWVSFNAGIVKPINNALVVQGNPTRHHIGMLNTSYQPVFSVSLFGVIPQKFVDKIKK